MDYTKNEKDLLNDYYNNVIDLINQYFDEGKRFTATDILNGLKDDYYYRYMTKGILLGLLAHKEIKIVGVYNGNKNFIYKSIKKIER